MASPQKEDGFTPIANEILDALCRKSVVLSDYEWTCLMFIFRKTYGWSKKEDRISLSQFVEGTHIQRPHVCRALKKLLHKNIITQSGNGKGVTYSFQKNYAIWKSLPKQVIITQTGNKVVPDQVMQVVPDQAHTKETITKEKKEKVPRGTPPDFIDQIKASPAYKHIDVDHELAKMDAWLLTRPQRKKTKRFVVNWLNKIEKPLAPQRPKGLPPEKKFFKDPDCACCNGTGINQHMPGNLKCQFCWRA